jgi:hypothetical protein
MPKRCQLIIFLFYIFSRRIVTNVCEQIYVADIQRTISLKLQPRLIKSSKTRNPLSGN